MKNIAINSRPGLVATSVVVEVVNPYSCINRQDLSVYGEAIFFGSLIIRAGHKKIGRRDPSKKGPAEQS